MPMDKDISIHLSCQQFECNRFDINEARSVLLFRSNRRSDEEVCPFCGGRVHVYDSACTTLKDTCRCGSASPWRLKWSTTDTDAHAAAGASAKTSA